MRSYLIPGGSAYGFSCAKRGIRRMVSIVVSVLSICFILKLYTTKMNARLNIKEIY